MTDEQDDTSRPPVDIDDLPKRLRVGPHDVRFARLSVADARRNYGAFVPAAMEIQLNPQFTCGSLAVDTVLHELVHAIFAVGSIQVKFGEEHVVSAIATYLAQIIRDNPEFVNWLTEAVARR